MPLLTNRRDPRLTKKLKEDHELRMFIIICLEGNKIGTTDLDFVHLSKPFYPNAVDLEVPTLRTNVEAGDFISTAI